MPCQSQSVKSVSVARTTGRSISHNSPVSFSISLSVSVGACTKNNTRPRALTSAVRSSALSTSSLSLHCTSPQLLARPYRLPTKSRRRSHREDCPADSRTVAFVLSIAPARHETLDESSPDTQENSMLGGRKVAVEKVRTKCRGTRRRRPRKWDRKEDDAPTTDLGSSNEANALC